MRENEDVPKEVSKKRKGLFARLRKFVIIVLIISLLTGSTMTVQEKPAEAFGFFCFCIGIACDLVDVIVSSVFFFLWVAIWDPIIQRNIHDHINSEINWVVDDFFSKFFSPGLQEMTMYLSSVGMYQLEIIGALLDAKQQLETQRVFWRLHAEAHKDYHPSDDFCWFGTNTRSLAASEDRSGYVRSVLAKRMMDRQLGNKNANAASGESSDKEGRWNQFVKRYCDVRDNNWHSSGTGLDKACDHDGASGGDKGATDPLRVNRDLDFTRLIDFPRTLEVDFSDAAAIPVPADEEDVLAMASNLYGNKVLTRKLGASELKNNKQAQNLYMILRSVAAKRSIAENSFNALVAMKSAGTGQDASSTAPKLQQVRQYMASLVKDLMPAATTDEEIFAMIGENPSYYSQLELLAKRIYENPDFYANLYDTPANVKRKSVAMKAIDMMLDRALFESELRQEMLLSVLLSDELRPRFRTTNKNLQKGTD